MNWKQRIFAGLRIVIPIVLLGWIIQQVSQDVEDPRQLRDLFSSRNLPGLALAIIPWLSAVVLTFWRWFILVRALRIPFRFQDALRLGFVGYFLQFLSLGTVGGDLFKAVFLARERPNRRPEAVATVFIDRAVGLFSLLLVTCVAFIFLGWQRIPAELHVAAISCYIVTAIGCFVVAGLLWTRATTRPIRQRLSGFPAFCAVLIRGEHALQLYRDHRRSFLVAVLAGMISHCLLATTAYVAANVLTDKAPTFGEQVVMWNISGAVGTLPLSPGGVGTVEATYLYLYKHLPSVPTQSQHGAGVALILRIVSVAVAAIGVIVYWFCRAEMRELFTEAQKKRQPISLEEVPAGVK